MDKARRQGLNGLSIIYITALQAWRQIDKAICRQIDKPQYGAYHQSNGLSNPQSKTVYKEIPNTPIYTYKTISSGIWAYRRFEGLKGLDRKV
jgi:hypothetical protein